MAQVRETDRIAELSAVLPDTDEFGREIAVPEVDAYRQTQKQQEATGATEDSVENGAGKLVGDGSEATELDNDGTDKTPPSIAAATGDESTQKEPVAGGDDADQSKEMAQDKTNNEQEPPKGKGDEETEDSSKSLVLKVVTEVPSSISRELALPQPKPPGPAFFLSTFVDAQLHENKRPVAGLFSLRRMLNYTKMDTAEKTMEVLLSQPELGDIIVVNIVVDHAESCFSLLARVRIAGVLVCTIECRYRCLRRCFEKCSHEMRWWWCARLWRKRW